MSEEEIAAVVLDFGSFTSKVGYAGDSQPRSEFHTVVSRRREDPSIGEDAWDTRGAKGLRYPVEYGVITNWEEFERIVRYTFTDALSVCPSDQSVLLTEPAPNPRVNREMLTKLMFESLEVRSVYIAPQPVLSALACGTLSGLVLNSGHSSTETVPIYEGHVLPHAIMGFPLGGYHVTTELYRLLHARNKYTLSRSNDDTVRDMKEKLCYVALNLESELQASVPDVVDKNYALPDGRVITLADERCRCAEIMFQPSLHDIDRSGVHELLYYSCMRCDPDLQELMFSNVVLSGGNTLFPGLPERLKSELTNKLQDTPYRHVNVWAPDAGKHAAWLGGSMLASSSSFRKMAVTKEEYDEFGPSIVHMKCF